MPYENEHSARLREPGDFDENPVWRDGKPGKFRRTDDGKLYGKKVPPTISIIWGKLKGKAGKKDPPIPQALRFPTKNWTADEAKKWLKDNEIKYIRFEPASGSKESQSDNLYLQELRQDPSIFVLPGTVEFGAGQEEEQKNRVRLHLYDGSIVKHWFWGNLAFEQKTMRMAKRRNPVLFEHDHSQRIAVSEEVKFEPEFVMEGKFLKTSEIAEQVRNQMDEGFPFEASLRFDPDRSKAEHILEGQTAEVNGRVLKGPGTIIRHALILEGSICVFGALNNTKSQIFQTIVNKEHIMENEEIQKMSISELTLENMPTILPELSAKLIAKGRAEAEQAAKLRFSELQKVCGDDTALLVECFAQDKTAADASQARLTKLEAEKKKLTEENAKLKAGKIDPAVTEFTSSPPPGTSGKFDENKATDEQLKEHFGKTQELQDQFSSAEAYIAAVRHPAR